VFFKESIKPCGSCSGEVEKYLEIKKNKVIFMLFSFIFVFMLLSVKFHQAIVSNFLHIPMDRN
jgi:hypothetical protein